MQITKMHGLGNDFILTQEMPAHPAQTAAAVCTRRLNVGADGLVLVLPSAQADLEMRIFNADGSEAEMCGNAIRCVARYAYDRGLVRTPAMTVSTRAGIMRPEITEDTSGINVRVDMGRPDFEPEHIPALLKDPVSFDFHLEGRIFEAGAVRMGVPHMVVFHDRLDEQAVQHLGPLISESPLFPQQANVNFVTRTGDASLSVRTWERGAGRTMACGTGACAAAVIASRTGRTPEEVTVEMEAGTLYIEVTPEAVYMTGPAVYVFEGETL